MRNFVTVKMDIELQMKTGIGWRGVRGYSTVSPFYQNFFLNWNEIKQTRMHPLSPLFKLRWTKTILKTWFEFHKIPTDKMCESALFTDSKSLKLQVLETESGYGVVHKLNGLVFHYIFSNKLLHKLFLLLVASMRSRS
jgi:hypothetical protein